MSRMRNKEKEKEGREVKGCVVNRINMLKSNMYGNFYDSLYNYCTALDNFFYCLINI